MDRDVSSRLWSRIHKWFLLLKSITFLRASWSRARIDETVFGWPIWYQDLWRGDRKFGDDPIEKLLVSSKEFLQDTERKKGKIFP